MLLLTDNSVLSKGISKSCNNAGWATKAFLWVQIEFYL